MILGFDFQYSKVRGSNCAVEEIVEAFKRLRLSDLCERYEIYSELFREDWATDAGYVLLPGLSKNINSIESVIDFELVFLVGSIQNSALREECSLPYEDIISPFLAKEYLIRSIVFLKQGSRFYGPNLPAEQCNLLLEELNSRL